MAARSLSADGRVVKFKSRKTPERERFCTEHAVKLAMTLRYRLTLLGYPGAQQQAEVFSKGGEINLKTARKILAGHPSRRTTINVLEAVADHLGVFVGWLLDLDCPYKTLDELHAIKQLIELADANPLFFERLIRNVRSSVMSRDEAIRAASQWPATDVDGTWSTQA